MTTLTDGDKEIKKLLEQYIGVTLSNIYGYRMKKALIMVGDGDCGKSQLKHLVEKIIGNENYCGIDLENLEHRFGTANLYRKRLAGSSDMGFMKINELKIFKQITGGDSIFGELKGKDGFSFQYKGLLWFCANQKPYFGGDRGDWVYNRMIFIDCKNVIPKEKQDKKLLEKMYMEREGIVRKCILALKSVIDAGYNYTIPKSVEISLDNYKLENSSVLTFISDCIVAQPKDKTIYDISCKQIYDIYCEWCKDNNNFREGKKTFFATFVEHFGYDDMKAATTNRETRYFKDYTLSDETKTDYQNLIKQI